MPIYEYQCPECKKIVEEIRTFAEADEPIGCSCRGTESPLSTAMVRILSRPSVRVNYSGLEHFGTPQYSDARSKQCGVGSL